MTALKIAARLEELKTEAQDHLDYLRSVQAEDLRESIGPHDEPQTFEDLEQLIEKIDDALDHAKTMVAIELSAEGYDIKT